MITAYSTQPLARHIEAKPTPKPLARMATYAALENRHVRKQARQDYSEPKPDQPVLLTKKQQAVVDYIAANPGKTREEARKALGLVSGDALTNHIHRLRAKGINIICQRNGNVMRYSLRVVE